MLRKNKDGVVWLEFELLQEIPGLFHGVFLRHGGVSQGPYASLNVGKSVGDDPACVQKNLDKVHLLSGLPHFVEGGQCHGIFIADVVPGKEFIPNCDGLITKASGLGLMIKHADCQAALFVDPTQRKIANVHAGWRGQVQNIYKEAILRMGSKPENLLVCISPSLGPEAAEFVNFKAEFPESFWPFQEKPNYFNLWEIARQQLLEAGILDSHIQIAKICTYSHPKDYFSYRRENVTGRHATVIGWRR